MNIALKNLASHLSEPMEEDDDPSRALVEKLGDSFKKVIEIELNEEPEGVYHFEQVRLDSFDAEDDRKYLYRGGNVGTGAGDTITCKLGKPRKTDRKLKTVAGFAATALEKKVMGHLKEMGERAEGENAKLFGKSAFAALKTSKAKVFDEVAKLAELVTPTKDDAIVTLVITGPSGRRYPRDVEPLKDYFLQRVIPETREQKGMSSIGEDAVCSCCGERNQRVYCQPRTLPYFTFDKPGFIAGGFFGKDETQRKAWRNFPLCSECVLDVSQGFKAAKQRLRFSLSRVNYLLIPNFANWQSQSAKAIVDTLVALGKLTDESAQRDQEEIFVHRLSGEDNTASFNFLFYQPKQSRMEILSTLENVLPTRMSDIANAIDETNKHPLLAGFGDWTKAPKIDPIRVNFALLRDLYQRPLRTKREKPANLFLRAVQRVVYGQAFNRREFFDSAMRYVREELHEQQRKGRVRVNHAVHEALAVAFWLLQLRLMDFVQNEGESLTQRGGVMTEYPQLGQENLNEQFDDFFRTFKGLFEQESQKLCYLMGVLCAQVLDEQRKRHGNRQPFFRQLKELTLDEVEMRSLFPKLKSKLVEYNKDHFYWVIEQAIAERFRKAGSPWRMTKSETSFFFTLGLCEAKLFRSKSQTDEKPSKQE